MLYQRTDRRYLKLVAWEVYAIYEGWTNNHQKQCAKVDYKGGRAYSPLAVGGNLASVAAFGSYWVDGV